MVSAISNVLVSHGKIELIVWSIYLQLHYKYPLSIPFDVVQFGEPYKESCLEHDPTGSYKPTA